MMNSNFSTYHGRSVSAKRSLPVHLGQATRTSGSRVEPLEMLLVPCDGAPPDSEDVKEVVPEKSHRRWRSVLASPAGAASRVRRPESRAFVPAWHRRSATSGQPPGWQDNLGGEGLQFRASRMVAALGGLAHGGLAHGGLAHGVGDGIGPLGRETRTGQLPCDCVGINHRIMLPPYGTTGTTCGTTWPRTGPATRRPARPCRGVPEGAEPASSPQIAAAHASAARIEETERSAVRIFFERRMTASRPPFP